VLLLDRLSSTEFDSGGCGQPTDSRHRPVHRQVDWEGKKALIQTAKAMGIERYVFFSIDGCDKHPEVCVFLFVCVCVCVCVCACACSSVCYCKLASHR
jgi:hypothetical protein